MSKKVWRPLNTYGLILISGTVFTVIGYLLAQL
jgi:hypothetical protein